MARPEVGTGALDCRIPEAKDTLHRVTLVQEKRQRFSSNGSTTPRLCQGSWKENSPGHGRDQQRGPFACEYWRGFLFVRLPKSFLKRLTHQTRTRTTRHSRDGSAPAPSRHVVPPDCSSPSSPTSCLCCRRWRVGSVCVCSRESPGRWRSITSTDTRPRHESQLMCSRSPATLIGFVDTEPHYGPL